VIDMRYENPLYMAEDAGAADLIAGGRLQLGISRGSPEQVIDGWRYFGYRPAEGQSDADMGRQHAEMFLTMLGGEAAATEKARKVVSSFSTEVLEIGQLGAGMALKISNNLVTWVELVVGMQATSLAKHYGVPYEKLRAVMKANGNLSPTMEGMLDGHQKVPRGVNAEYDAFVTSQAGIGEKDLALAAECGEVAGLNMEFAHRSRDILRRAMLREPQSVG